MAMCGSGNFGILSTPQGGCSSISCAVTGNATPPKSLSVLAACANKPLPVNMTTCWYGYNQKLITTSIITSNCGAGVTADGCLSIVSTPAMGAGECYCLCLNGCLNSGGGAGSSGCWVVYLNGTKCYCCTVGTNACVSPSYSTKMCLGTTVCLCLHAVITAGLNYSCSFGNIGCITPIVSSYGIGACSSYNLRTC